MELELGKLVRWVLSKWPFLHFPICAVRKIVPHEHLEVFIVGTLKAELPGLILPFVSPLRAVEKIKVF